MTYHRYNLIFAPHVLWYSGMNSHYLSSWHIFSSCTMTWVTYLSFKYQKYITQINRMCCIKFIIYLSLPYIFEQMKNHVKPAQNAQICSISALYIHNSKFSIHNSKFKLKISIITKNNLQRLNLFISFCVKRTKIEWKSTHNLN